MSVVAEQLPRWNMDVVYPSLESSEFRDSFQAIVAEIEDFAGWFDTHGIDKQDEVRVDDDTVAALETIVQRLNDLLARFVEVQAYIASFVTTDSRDNAAQAGLSELQQQAVVEGHQQEASSTRAADDEEK